MSKHWYNILIINFLSIVAVAKEPISLEAALSKSLLKAEVTKHPSEDETRHRNLRVSLRNLTNAPINIIIPTGFIFTSADSSVQDFINLDDKVFEIAAAKSKVTFVTGRCIRANRLSPKDGALYIPNQLAAGHLLALTQWAAQHKAAYTDAMQSALWAITDNHDLSGINHLEMAKLVAEKLKKPLPDYFTRYRFREIGGVTAAQSLEPLEIHGQFTYTLANEQVVILDLIDEHGVSAFAGKIGEQQIKQSEGTHRFKFNMKLRGIGRGTYYVTMRSVLDKQLISQMKVTF